MISLAVYHNIDESVLDIVIKPHKYCWIYHFSDILKNIIECVTSNFVLCGLNFLRLNVTVVLSWLIQIVVSYIKYFSAIVAYIYYVQIDYTKLLWPFFVKQETRLVKDSDWPYINFSKGIYSKPLPNYRRIQACCSMYSNNVIIWFIKNQRNNISDFFVCVRNRIYNMTSIIHTIRFYVI